MKAKHLLNLVSDRLHTLPLLVMYLTDGCNSRCITCDIWRNPRFNMKMELVEQIAAEIDKLQIRWLLLSGGEAMQHPQWPAIARRFRDAGVYVMLLTNGLLVKKQAQEVIESVDELIVSLDAGDAPTYQAIRGVDAFDLVMEGIEVVRRGGIPVATRTTVQQANYAQIPQIIEVAKAADVNRISFLTVDVASNIAFGTRFESDLPMVADLGPMPGHGPPTTALNVDEIQHLAQILDEVEDRFAADFATGRIEESPEKLRRMVDYFGAISGQRDFIPPRCNAPHVSTVIGVDGTLQPCYFLPAWGKLNGRQLSQAVNDDDALALRHAYRNGLRPECERCVCPLYKGPRSLLRM